MKTMASKVSNDLRLLLANAHLAPTFHLHTTFWGIANQSERTPDGKLQFLGGKVQEDAAQESFDQTYILLVQVMDVLNGYYDLKRSDTIHQLNSECAAACKAADAKNERQS
jgi:hypothetical protein